MHYDLAILGGGPGGYNAAERAAEAGMKVVLCEPAALGGVCLNEGCIPTKTMLYSAKLHDGAAHGERYGVAAEGLSLDHGKVLARKAKVVRTLVAGVKSALKTAGVEVLAEKGTLVKKTAEGFALLAGQQSLAAKNVLVATGSAAAVPPIPGVAEGLAAGRVLTSREALACEEIPQRLAVIGGGVIGLELASYFCSAGSEVAVVEMLDHIAGDADSQLAAVLQKNYEKKGVAFHLGAKVTKVDEDGVHFEKDGEPGLVAADKILLSVGRRPVVEGLGLEALGVAVQKGAIATGEHMETNIPGLYAAGDVNGISMLAHTAYRGGEVAVNHMLGRADAMRYDAIPGVVYTNPEYASVGHTEQSAAAAGLAVQVVRLPMRFSGRYLAENEGGDGGFALVADPQRRVIVGAQALGNYASEFIVAAGAFITLQTPVEEIKKVVFPHPTVGEILREAIFRLEL